MTRTICWCDDDDDDDDYFGAEDNFDHEDSDDMKTVIKIMDSIVV